MYVCFGDDIIVMRQYCSQQVIATESPVVRQDTATVKDMELDTYLRSALYSQQLSQTSIQTGLDLTHIATLNTTKLDKPPQLK